MPTLTVLFGSGHIINYRCASYTFYGNWFLMNEVLVIPIDTADIPAPKMIIPSHAIALISEGPDDKQEKG